MWYTLSCPLSNSTLYRIIDRNVEKESIREFLNKKREMFYFEVQFVLTYNTYKCSECFFKFQPF